MKKLLVILMLLAMMLTMFVSCEKEIADENESNDVTEEITEISSGDVVTETPTEAPVELTAEQVIEKANAATMASPYRILTSMKFSSDNAEMNEALSMVNMEYPVVMDGNNLFTEISMDLGEGMIMSITMTLVGNELYYDVDIAGTAQKMKATLSDEQLKVFLDQNSSEMPVSPSDFGKLSMEEKDKTYTIAFEELSENGKKMLDEKIASSLAGMEATAEMKDLSYVTTIVNGKFNDCALSCDYSMAMEDMAFNVKMEITMTYEYDDIPEIKVPADASAYTEVPAEQLIG